jgi:hypothetical protein
VDELDLLRLRETADPYYLADKNQDENRKYSQGTHAERFAKLKELKQLLCEAESLRDKLDGKPDDYRLSIEDRCKAAIQQNEVVAITIDLRRKIAYADPNIDLDMERLKAGERVPSKLYMGPRGGLYEWASGKDGFYRKYH